MNKHTTKAERDRLVDIVRFNTLGERAEHVRIARRLIAERDELAAIVERLQTADFYWDDNNLEYAIPADEAGAYDDVGDIVELRPIHELPTRFLLVGDEHRWFDTREAAEAAKSERSE